MAKQKRTLRKKTSGIKDLVANPIEDRPNMGRKQVVSKRGGVVASRTEMSPPEIGEVGFLAVPDEKRKGSRERIR